MKKVSQDHWIVKFHDDKVKELAENMMAIVNTFELNQPVLAKSSQLYKKGVIIDVRA